MENVRDDAAESLCLPKPEDIPHSALRPEQQALSFTVEEQPSDVRSLQFQCKLTFRNGGSRTIRILFVRPLTPYGAELQEVTDTSQSDSRLAMNDLYADLNVLLGSFMLEHSKEYRNNMILSMRDYLKENLSVLGLGKFYFNIIRFNMEAYAKRITANRQAWTLRIRSADRAEQHYIELLKPYEEEARDLCAIFRSKVVDVKQLEAELGSSSEVESIAEIDPGDDFTMTYLFNCTRRILNARTYTFSFECGIQEEPFAKTRYLSNSISTTISPKPFVLNIVSIFSAILGALLKIGVDMSTNNNINDNNISLFILDDRMLRSASIQIITAMITALFFYNIYDSTEVGSKLRLGLGWRSALIIGGLSGFLNERVVAALHGLLG